jgi:hypothetical protein
MGRQRASQCRCAPGAGPSGRVFRCQFATNRCGGMAAMAQGTGCVRRRAARGSGSEALCGRNCPCGSCGSRGDCGAVHCTGQRCAAEVKRHSRQPHSDATILSGAFPKAAFGNRISVRRVCEGAPEGAIRPGWGGMWRAAGSCGTACAGSRPWWLAVCSARAA